MQRCGTGVPEIARCYPEAYEELLADKVTTMQSMVTEAVVNGTPADVSAPVLPRVEVFKSERENFRMRANFKIWREGPELHYVMFNRDDTTPQQVVTYPMGSRQLNELMGPLLQSMQKDPVLSTKINDVRFLTTLTGDALISVTYNRPIDGTWEAAAAELAASLGPRVRLVGRSRKVKIVIGGEMVNEVLHVPERGECLYSQTEGAFTQPNAHVCESMLGWAFNATKGLDGTDLCELYCGNGCFTVALSPNFRRVIATEMSKASVLLAEENLRLNAIDNVQVARLTAEEFVEAHSGVRRFQRLADAGIHLGREYDGIAKLETLFVDPPRAGLDATCRALAKSFKRVVYVSCNPETLSRDLEELAQTHDVTALAAFDQFPYTPHLECGVVLVRRADAHDV